MNIVKKNFPDYVMIETASFCNARCIMCPYESTSKKFKPGTMKEELFKKIIKECSYHDNIKIIMLYLFNEPLLDKNIVERINYAKTLNPNALVNIVSNGSLLTKTLSNELINSKLDYIEFSVHGIKRETYNKIMKGLEFNETVNNISRFIDLAKKNNKHPGYINIKILGIPGILGKEEIEEATVFWKSKNVNISSYEAPISRAGNIEWMKKVEKKEVHGCNSIWRNELIPILHTGEAILCCMDWEREMIFGNLNKDSIEDVWNSSKKRKIENMICGDIDSPSEFICKRCEESS